MRVAGAGAQVEARILSPRISLVGAGPGDPELLTLRAARLLGEADVVFHDALVGGAVLERAAGAELVAVGHRAGERRIPLKEVVGAMIARARRGERVVRLKGGDPFLFGRGAEEAAVLLEGGVSFEVVPGISSSLAAPAAAGIPVTHRRLARSVTIVAGHECDGPSRVAWEHIAMGSDTLVILMGAARVGELAEKLIAAGRSAATPAAMVMAATRPEQLQVVATLGSLAEAASAAGIGAPATLVVGDVCQLAAALASGGQVRGPHPVDPDQRRDRW
jgi:uroporphyrin-III C-methyltransferase